MGKITFEGEKCDQQSQQIEAYLQRAIAECVAHPKVPTPNLEMKRAEISPDSKYGTSFKWS